MNKKTFSLFARRRSIRAVVLLTMAVTATLASCSSEDMTDNPVETLPEGMYPLTFTATQGEVVATPQTRVSEGTDGNSKWDGGEQIKVTVKENSTGKESITTCTLNESGSIDSYNPQLYWQTTGNHTINAWYSNISGQNTTSNTVNLSDQRSGLAYVLKADELTDKNYQSGSLPLFFKHQLAKVRVKLVKGTTAADLTNAIVTIKNQYTDCSIDNTGTVSSKGNANGTITMHKPTTTDGYYEANIVPGTSLTAGTNTVSATTPAITTTNDGEMYTFTITVDKPGPLQPVGGVFTINAGDNVTIESHTGTEPIVVNGNSTITIRKVNLTTTGNNVMTINNGATVTLNVEGTENEFKSTDKAGIKIIDTNNENLCGNITINGTDKNSSKLKVTAGSGAAIGFNMVGNKYHLNIWFCGDIEINNITLEAQGGSGSPAIGISAIENDASDYSKKYGKISINSSTVNVSSTNGAACIGTPRHTTSSPFFFKGISITSSTVTATAGGNQAACIGFGYTTNTAFNKEIEKIEFFDSTLNLTTGYTNKVGFGDGDDSRKLTGGIWNNNKVGDTDWNP